MKAVLIINPAAGNGRTGRCRRRLEKQIRCGMGLPFDPILTERPGHATEIVRDRILRGAEMMVSVGGDGTHHEVLNGFFQEGELINPKACMATITVGTGGDFIKTLGWEKTVDFALRRIAARRVRPLDVGLVECLGPDGKACRRYFMNMADFGAGGVVVRRVNGTSKILGGRMSFLWGIVSTLVTYKNRSITYTVDDQTEHTAILNNVIIGNGRYYGGGIRAAPHARLDDGFLDVVFIGDVGFTEALANLHRFRKGTHLNHPKISWMPVRVIEARSQDPVYINMDGECTGTLPARFHILPKKILFVV